MIVHILAILGSLCFLIASVGLIRMPDPLARVHAATKASSLGVILLLLADGIEFPTAGSLFLSFLTLVLVLLTAPMAAQAIASRLIPPSRRNQNPKDSKEAE